MILHRGRLKTITAKTWDKHHNGKEFMKLAGTVRS